MVAKYISKLNNAQLDVYYSQHSAEIPLPHSGIKNKNYKVLLQITEANQIEQQDDASFPKVADELKRPL